MANTIKLKKYLDLLEEYTATAAVITPGMLLEVTSTGAVKAHATAGGNVLPMFALEDELQGNGIADNYAASAKIQVWVPQRGEEVNAILAAGQNVSIGDFLESNGAGKLRAHGADSTGIYYPNVIVGIAMAAVDLSGSGAVDTKIRVKII
ncbi:MAG: hypothetical protein KKC20_24645 [Proteobacteria bacterium]|nr:hypothetical protein [Pseudomonadota bacterium]